jgi:hypothetical protein
MSLRIPVLEKLPGQRRTGTRRFDWARAWPSRCHRIRSGLFLVLSTRPVNSSFSQPRRENQHSWDRMPSTILVHVYRNGEFPAKVYMLDIQNNQKKLVRQLMPKDPAGVNIISPIWVTPDGKSYAYGYRRIFSDLYLIEGLK